MKLQSKFLKRGLAMALTLAMVLSMVSHGGFLPKAYAEGETSVTLGELMAENYDLTAAEEALLTSGQLAQESYTYVAPTNNDGLVSVDSDAKTITVKNYDDKKDNTTWTVNSVSIVVGGKVVETANGANGVYTYAYEGNAFSVVVEYAMTVTADTTAQESQMLIMSWFKNGVKNADAVAELAGSLYILEQAMPQLVNLADNGYAMFGFSQTLNESVKDAIYNLNGQMTANGGKMDLSVMIDAYGASSKTQYIVNNGGELKAVATSTAADVEEIDSILKKLKSATAWENAIAQEYIDLVNLLADVVADLSADLSTILADGWWTGAAEGAVVDLTSSSVDYAELNSLVAALPETLTSVSYNETLAAGTASVQYNMSMYDVTVQVNLRTVDANNEFATTAGETVVLTLAENASKDEVYAAIVASGVMEKSQAKWGELYSDTYYNMVCDLDIEELTKDITVTITYAPNSYKVEGGCDELNDSYPYGYKLTLPVLGEEGKVYDYFVNDEYVPEGSVITITGDTEITREVGKAYVQSSIYAYLAGTSWVTETHADALTSGAMLGDEALNIRYPEGDLISLDGNELTVQATFPSSYQGLNWVPGYYVVNNGASTGAFDGKTTVTLPDDFEQVTVYYVLSLDAAIGDKVRAAAALVNTLMTEAEGQLSALDRLNSIYGDLGQLDKTKLGALNGVIDVTDGISETLKAEFKSIVSAIIANNLEGNNLRVYNQLTSYREGGLTYYYKNSEAVINEVASLSAYLNQMVETEEKVAALVILCNAAGYPQYADLVGELADKMASISADLTAPNAAIDLTSSNLPALTAALTEGADRAPEIDGVMELVSAGFTKVADKYADLTVSLEINDTASTIPYAGSVLAGATFTQEMADAIIASIEAKVAEADKDTDLYTCDSNLETVKAEINACVGKEARNFSASTVKVTWTAKSFTVSVVGMADQTFTADDSYTIELAQSADPDVRYEYTVDGKTVTSSVYTFTADQLKTLFVDGKYTVSRNVVDTRREALINMVNKLNAETDDSITFALVENNGEYSIVMRTETSSLAALKTGAVDFAMGLVNSGYSYIAVDNEPVLYMNEENTLAISLQSLVDAVMNSGVGTETMLSVMDSNGAIDVMTLDGEVISFTALPDLGGELIATTMQLGNDATDAQTVDFYITLGDAHSKLVSVRNAYEQHLKEYVSVVLDDGCAQVLVDLGTGKGDKIYQAYLAAMLLTDQVDLTDIDALNSEIAVEFLRDLLAPAIDENVTVQTYLNTLEKVGLIDGAESREAFETIFNYLREGYNSLEFTYPAKDTTQIDANVPMHQVLDALNMGDLVKMIVEYETGLDVAAKVVLENFNHDYNAMFLDWGADGYLNKAGFTTLSGNCEFDSYAVVVLTGDMTANLTFNGTTVLNLNGYDLTGNVTGNGKVFIVDTSVVDDGSISGTVSGSCYMADAADFYDLVKAENGDITIEIDAAALSHEWKGIDIATLAMDIVADLVFNGYPVSKLYVEGHQIYEVALDDLVDIYAGEGTAATLFDAACGFIDSEELAAAINMAIADITAFADLQSAVEADQNILSYSVTTGNWNFEVEHITDGDYLTVNVGATQEKTFNLNVKIVGSEADKQLAADLLYTLADTTTVDASVSGAQDNDSNTLFLDWSAQGEVVVDLTHNGEYAALLCVLLANGNSNNADLIAALKDYAKTGSLVDLEAAFNAVTTAEAIGACKSLQYSDTVESLLAELGLDLTFNTIKADAILTAAKQVAAVLRQTDFVGGDRNLGTFFNASLDGYGFTRSNIERNPSISARGYGLEALLSLENVTVVVKIWPDHVHTPGEAVIENEVKATCTADGSYDSVVYCATCGEELSRETITVPAAGHTAGDPVVENKVEATCTTDGSYDTVVYCSVCGVEISRETVTVAATGHTPGEAVVENKVDATCTTDGSYDTVVYCSVCGEELSRETVTVPATGHTAGEVVVENKVDATCTTDGSYDNVTYCTICGAEVSRETVTVAATGHTPGDAVYENIVNPTCTEGGSADRVVYCTVCGTELSREPVTAEALGHSYGDWVVVKEATETETGLKEKTCAVCGDKVQEVIPMLDAPEQPDDDTPDTGDAAPYAIVLMLAMVSAAAIVLLGKKRRA